MNIISFSTFCSIIKPKPSRNYCIQTLNSIWICLNLTDPESSTVDHSRVQSVMIADFVTAIPSVENVMEKKTSKKNSNRQSRETLEMIKKHHENNPETVNRISLKISFKINYIRSHPEEISYY